MSPSYWMKPDAEPTGPRYLPSGDQYTIQADNVQDLSKWVPILLDAMKRLPGLQDVSSDQQNGGLEVLMNYDRVTAAKLGLTVKTLDSALYSAFGQSEVSIILNPA
jgi:multidrug efflux pump